MTLQCRVYSLIVCICVIACSKFILNHNNNASVNDTAVPRVQPFCVHLCDCV
jgi:hypothetical protein